MATIDQATVKVTFEQSEVANADQTNFQLTVKVSDPDDFPLYLRDEYPDYPFLYQVQDLNTVDEAPFQRVATINDLRTYGTTYQNVSDYFRRNIYTKRFETAEEMLGAQELITRNLRTLYSDINTLFNYISTIDATSEITLPTYVETKVDSLVTQLKELRYEVQENQTKVQLIEKTVLPILEFNLETVVTQSEVVSSIISYITGFSIDLPNLDVLQVSLDNIDTKFIEAEDAITTFNSKLTQIQTSANNALVSAEALSANVQGQLRLNLQDITLNHTQALATVTFDKAFLRSDLAVSRRAIRTLRNINLSQVVETDELLQLQDLIKVNENKIREKIDISTREVAEYKATIESLKADIQTVEAELVKLVPSINLGRPEDFWAVNVIIET